MPDKRPKAAQAMRGLRAKTVVLFTGGDRATNYTRANKNWSTTFCRNGVPIWPRPMHRQVGLRIPMRPMRWKSALVAASLAARAKADRHIGHIGCEPFINGVAKLLIDVERDDLTNVAVHDDDARPLMATLPDQCLAAAYLLCPDLWPKKRHNKRRFINRENLDALFRILRPGAAFLVASDIADYLDWTLVHIRAHGGFAWQATKSADWLDPPEGWPGTRYEAKAQGAGRKAGYLHFVRRDTQSPGFL